MVDVLSAVKAIIQDGDKFLLIKTLYKGKTFWDLPGGKIVYGENPHDTLHREIKEETGLDVDIINPMGVWWFFRIVDKKQVVCNTFLCKPKHTNVDTTKNPSNEENIQEFRWVTKDEFLSDEYDTTGYESLKELISRL
ncbi:NUDIX domain-containing protein [Candidatus Aenigmatarchaeota archaeon]